MSTTSALVADGKVVSIKYILRNGDGEVLDQSEPGDPLFYLHGQGNIVPGLERQLAGKSVGDRVAASVAPEEGYGARNEAGVQRVPRAAFGDIPLEVGMDLLTEDEQGRPMPLWVKSVGQDTVEIDFNHPLAGVTLNFSVEIVAVRDATADELAHGHAHGPTGHEGHGHHH